MPSNLPELKVRVGADSSGVRTGMKPTLDGIKALEQGMAEAARKGESFGARLSAAFVSIRTQPLIDGISELDAAMRRGAISQEAHAQILKQMGQNFTTVTGNAANLNRSFGQATLGGRGLETQLRRTTVPLGALISQASSGTMTMQGLAQTLPALIGGFGLLGAAAGAAVAVAGGIATSFLDQEDRAKLLTERVSDLSRATSSYRDAVDRALLPLPKLWKEFGTGAVAAQEIYKSMLDLERLDYFKAQRAAMSELENTLGKALKAFDAYRTRVTEYTRDDVPLGKLEPMRKAVEAIIDGLGLTMDEAGRLRDALDDLGTAQGPQAVADASRRIADVLMEAQRAGGAVSDELLDAARAAYELALQAAKVAPLLDDAAAGADDTADAAARARDRTYDWAAAMASVKREMDGIRAIFATLTDSALPVTARYVELEARKAGKSKAEAARARKEFEIEAAAQGELVGANWYERFLIGVEKQIKLKGLDIDEELAALDAAERADSGGGGGGGGGGKRDSEIERRLERLREGLKDERTVLVEAHETRLADLQEARENELLTEQEYNQLRLQEEASFQEAMANLQRQQMDARLSAWSGALGDLSTLMNTENKKLFQVGKTAALAQAIVDGWSAATSAYRKGVEIGGPATGAAFAAMSLARTGAMIASIRATQFEGGGSTSSGGGATAAPAAPATPLQATLNLQGPLAGAFRDSLGNLLDGLNKEAGDRGYQLMVRAG